MSSNKDVLDFLVGKLEEISKEKFIALSACKFSLGLIQRYLDKMEGIYREQQKTTKDKATRKGFDAIFSAIVLIRVQIRTILEDMEKASKRTVKAADAGSAPVKTKSVAVKKKSITIDDIGTFHAGDSIPVSSPTGKLKILSIEEGFVMARYKGCAVFCQSENMFKKRVMKEFQRN